MKKSEEFEFWGKTAIDFAKLTYAGGLLFGISYWLTTKEFYFPKILILIVSSSLAVIFMLYWAKRLIQKAIEEEHDKNE